MFHPAKTNKLRYLYNFFEIPKFSKFSNNRRAFFRTIPGGLTCQISGSYVYFLQKYSAKTVFTDEAIFPEILSISRHRTEIKVTFLESRDQSSSEILIYIRKYHFENLAFLTGVDMTLPCFSLA